MENSFSPLKIMNSVRIWLPSVLMELEAFWELFNCPGQAFSASCWSFYHTLKCLVKDHKNLEYFASSQQLAMPFGFCLFISFFCCFNIIQILIKFRPSFVVTVCFVVRTPNRGGCLREPRGCTCTNDPGWPQKTEEQGEALPADGAKKGLFCVFSDIVKLEPLSVCCMTCFFCSALFLRLNHVDVCSYCLFIFYYIFINCMKVPYHNIVIHSSISGLLPCF